MLTLKNILFGAMLFCLLTPMYAQYTAAYKNPYMRYEKALDLYEKSKYNSAKEEFRWVSLHTDLRNGSIRENALYYSAVCDMRLYHPNGPKQMLTFIETYPESIFLNDAYLELGNYEYANKDYQQALLYYIMVDPTPLSRARRDEFLFRNAYANFSQKRYADAKMAFHELKENSSRYQAVASYYYAYILYTEGHYETALKDFRSLEKDENFGFIAPFYIVQIYYMQEKYDSVLKLGLTLLPDASPRRVAELSRLVGEAYYYTGKYREALPYLKNYFTQSAVVPTREDNYILGYVYYQLNKVDTAVLYFQKAVSQDKKDALQQNALYHLAYCYVMTGNKRFALNSFLAASKIDVQPKIKEDAMFSYVKLAYELTIAPYNETIDVMQKYLNEYPDSKYKDQVYGYLVSVFTRTRNYKEAIASIEKIQRRDPMLMEALQRVAFNRGIELYYEKKYVDAVSSFQKSISENFNENITSQAYYWQGESYYKLAKYDSAVLCYDRSLYLMQDKQSENYAMSQYALAYAYFQDKNYAASFSIWKELLAKENKMSDNKVWQDAWVRAGDAAFMLKKYNEAIQDYDSAMQLGTEPLDYVGYQKALALGANGSYDSKIKLLSGWEKKYPQSIYMASVLNELALTYLILENNEKAIHYYETLAEDYKNSPYARTALLKQGLIYFNQGKNEKALKILQALVENNSSSAEAKQGLVSIRNIYIAMNKVDDFFAYAKKIPNVKIEQGEEDSITFLASETQYMENDCQSAVKGFQSYVQKFPQGYFIEEAWHYLADCAYKLGEWGLAREAYAKVVEYPLSHNTEISLLRLAKLEYDAKDYQAANIHYLALQKIANNPSNTMEALMGTPRCLYALGEYNSMILPAQELLKMEGLAKDKEEEIRIYIARAAKHIGDKLLAMKEYKQLMQSKNTEYYAESNYAYTESLLGEGKWNEAEKVIFDYISRAPGNEYYLAKMYILWADIYKERKNLLQAKQTLQSIIDNYEGEDLIQEAKERKAAIEALEEALKIKEQTEREQLYSEEEEIVIPGFALPQSIELQEEIPAKEENNIQEDTKTE